jgi:hypothetical protein
MLPSLSRRTWGQGHGHGLGEGMWILGLFGGEETGYERGLSLHFMTVPLG